MFPGVAVRTCTDEQQLLGDKEGAAQKTLTPKMMFHLIESITRAWEQTFLITRVSCLPGLTSAHCGARDVMWGHPTSHLSPSQVRQVTTTSRKQKGELIHTTWPLPCSPPRASLYSDLMLNYVCLSVCVCVCVCPLQLLKWISTVTKSGLLYAEQPHARANTQTPQQ